MLARIPLAYILEALRIFHFPFLRGILSLVGPQLPVRIS